MLAPKKIKWRKPHRRYPKGTEHFRGNRVVFGEYGLQAITNGWITANQIEAARVALSRKLKKSGKIWIRIFPDLSLTKKPAETRMGGGKGAPETWVAVVKKGRILFEVVGSDKELIYRALKIAADKLPVKCRIVEREE